MADSEDKKPAEPAPPVEKLSVTRHRTTAGGTEFGYTATCGTLVLREESEKEGKREGDKARASVFFVAYARDDADPGTRPVTYANLSQAERIVSVGRGIKEQANIALAQQLADALGAELAASHDEPVAAIKSRLWRTRVALRERMGVAAAA